MRTEAEVLEGLTAVLRSTEDQSVASGRSTESELVQGDGLTTGGGNSGTGSGSESKSGDGGLGEAQKSVVIGDGADDDDGALLALLVDVGNNAGQRNGRAVDLGHEESSKDNLVEGGIGSAWGTIVSRSIQPPRNRQFHCLRYKLTGQEAVKLDQELQVDIVALGGLAVSALDVVAVEIDTWKLETVSARWFMLKCGCSSSQKRAPRSQRDTQGIITTRIRRLCQFFHVPMATTGAEKLDDGLESRSRKCLGIQGELSSQKFQGFRSRLVL